MSEKPVRLGRADFRLFRAIPTRWLDNDAFGHVNNVVYYSWFDTIVNAWLVEQGFLDIMGSAVVGVVARTQCDYFDSIAFPETAEGGLAVERLGRSSVTYRLGIFRQGAELAAAQGLFMHVYVERSTQAPVPIPAKLRAAMAEIGVG